MKREDRFPKRFGVKTNKTLRKDDYELSAAFDYAKCKAL